MCQERVAFVLDHPVPSTIHLYALRQSFTEQNVMGYSPQTDAMRAIRPVHLILLDLITLNNKSRTC
jgi:hypothetical protein